MAESGSLCLILTLQLKKKTEFIFRTIVRHEFPLIVTSGCQSFSLTLQTNVLLSKVMFIDFLKERIMSLAVEIIIYMLVAVTASAKGSCPSGEFYFAHGRNMVENYALRGHVFANITAKEPIRCFRACQLDCWCISFNYQQTGSKDNCQLNEENRYTNFSALEFVDGWSYYDLVIDYNIKVLRGPAPKKRPMIFG